MLQSLKCYAGAVVVDFRLQDQSKKMRAVRKFHISAWSSVPSELNEVPVSRIETVALGMDTGGSI